MSRKTRLVILSHVTCTTGQLLPVQKIGKLARDRGVWFALDGAQSAGHVPIDLKTLPVDFFATSGHKWMLGPKRTGILFVRRPLLDTLTPTTVGAYSDLSHDIRKQTLTFHPTAQRYEYATQNETHYRGLETAADLLECIGPDRIMERNYRLARTLYDGLSAIHGVALLSPLESAYRTCMITFKFREINYREAAGLLGKERFRVRVVPEGGVEGIRVSIHLYNRKEEVLNLLNAVDRLTG
jgi:L-cysteine/cystine lyase